MLHPAALPAGSLPAVEPAGSVGADQPVVSTGSPGQVLKHAQPPRAPRTLRICCRCSTMRAELALICGRKEHSATSAASCSRRMASMRSCSTAGRTSGHSRNENVDFLATELSRAGQRSGRVALARVPCTSASFCRAACPRPHQPAAGPLPVLGREPPSPRRSRLTAVVDMADPTWRLAVPCARWYSRCPAASELVHPPSACFSCCASLEMEGWKV